MKWFHALLAGILITLTWTIVCPGQVGSLTGDVRDLESNNPIQEAAVVLQTDTAWTNAQGIYSFHDIPVGTYGVTASKMGYASETDTAHITSQDTIRLDFFLPPIPIIEIDISSLDVVIPPGESHQETFNIINMGMRELTYDLNFTYEGMLPSILVVDDDGGSINNHGEYFDVHQFYIDALVAVELPFDLYVVDWSISPEQPGPDVTVMEQYDSVIWFTGECWGVYGNDTITPTDARIISTYAIPAPALSHPGSFPTITWVLHLPNRTCGHRPVFATAVPGPLLMGWHSILWCRIPWKRCGLT